MIFTAMALFLLFQGAPGGPTGVVTGELRTMEGAPAIFVRIAALPVPTANAKPEDGVQYFLAPPAEVTALTDRQGRYRLANIPPGRYYIMAGAVGQAATYYPAALNTDTATVVTVGPNSNTPNINFKLMRKFGGRLSGRVTQNLPPGPLKATLLGGKLEEVLDVPVGSDGSFEFGHVPPGNYLLGIFPQPPGLPSTLVKVGDDDVTGIQITPPPTRTVTGRIVVQNGPLPHSMLSFTTPQSYVGGTINPDGTFVAHLQPGRHIVDIAGMTVGYSVASVRIGSEDEAKGLVVGESDISGVVITVAAPRRLPTLHGTISGLAADRMASTKVEMTGPIIGSLQTAVQKDGSFEFPAVVPGLYRLRLTQVPEFKPMNVVVGGFDPKEVQVTVGR